MSGIKGIRKVFNSDQRQDIREVEKNVPRHLRYKTRGVLKKAVEANNALDACELFLHKTNNLMNQTTNDLQTLMSSLKKLQKDYQQAHEAATKVSNITLSVIKNEENKTRSHCTDGSEFPSVLHNSAYNQLAGELAMDEAFHALTKLDKSLKTTRNAAKKLPLADQLALDLNVNQYKLYAFVSDRLNKPVEDVSEEDIRALQSEYDSHMAHFIDQEFPEESHEQKLESSSSNNRHSQLTRAQKKKQKYREKKKAAAAMAKNALTSTQAAPEVASDELPALRVVVKTPEQEFLQKLNQTATSKKFKEDPRCVNWRKKCDYTTIKDIEGKFTYRDMTPEQMVFIAQQHRLEGANQLLSNKEAVRRYGMKYVWYNAKGVRQRGFKFPAVMITLTNTYAGTVQLAYDSGSKVIFHERFLPFGMDKKISTAKDLAQPLEALTLVDEEGKFAEDGQAQPWTNASPVTFKSGENGSLIWEIGEEAANRVTIILNRIRL